MSATTIPTALPVVHPIRLTRRGRLAVVGLVAALAFAGVSVAQATLGAFDASAGAESSTQSATTWVVQPGETLWSIAERIAPDTDPRETVARIVQMNDLPSSEVLVGQEIYLPS